MLAIRMQRVGRKGNPQYRLIAQESGRAPTSGRVVSQLGRYNPHSKEVSLDVPEIEKYLQNGAQPSDRVVKLLRSEGVKLPSWVTPEKKDDSRATKHPEKLRKNQPKEESTPEEEASKAPEASTAEASVEEQPAEETATS